MRCKFSTLLLSDTGEGKTTQIGLTALWHFKKTGGYVDPTTQKAVGGERTVLYSGDFGGWAVVQALIDLGIIYLVDLTQHTNPFDWLDKIASCKLPIISGLSDVGQPTFQWVAGGTIPDGPHAGATIGHYAYDSGTTFAYTLMNNLSSGEAGNIGGSPGIKFTQGDTITSNNNQSHYQVAQQAVLKAVAKSQVSTSGIVTWSFRLRRAESDTGQQLIGPQIAGSAMTPELPAWFSYTFHLSKQTLYGQEPTVVLYFDHHVDAASPTAKVLSNGRVPIGATAPPSMQSPANMPKMIDLLEAASKQSLQAIINSCPPPAGGQTAETL